MNIKYQNKQMFYDALNCLYTKVVHMRAATYVSLPGLTITFHSLRFTYQCITSNC